MLNRPRRLPTCNLHAVAAFPLFVKCSCLGAGAQQAWHAGHEADFCLALLPPLGPRLHRPRPALQGGRQPIPGAAQGGAPRQRRGCGAAAGEPSHGCRVREKGRHWQCSVRGGREAVLICHASAPGLGTRGRWRCLLRLPRFRRERRYENELGTRAGTSRLRTLLFLCEASPRQTLPSGRQCPDLGRGPGSTRRPNPDTLACAAQARIGGADTQAAQRSGAGAAQRGHARQPSGGHVPLGGIKIMTAW